MMVDIRRLNKIIVIDFYFLSLQFDITVLMINCEYIIVIDVAKFFHQWLIRYENKSKLIVVSHRDQKQFNVIVMKFKNSFFYVQRQIDNMLHFHQKYFRIYVNDIIIFFKTLDEHLQHLNFIFELLNFKEITLFLKKFFFDYFIVTFLR